MNRLITRLTEREREESRRDIKLGELLASVVVEVSDGNPRPTLHGVEQELTVSVDRDRLAAVFSHLLRNAQDACSEDGEITVTMGQSGMSAEVAVKDTGCGMDETFIRERLFRPFESTKGSGGMGIGAYQVREYVRDLQGQLRVESKVGSGTCVTVILPLQSA